MRSQRWRSFALRSAIVLGAMVSLTILLFFLNARAQSPRKHFAGEITVTYLGKTTTDIVGVSTAVVEPGGKPNVAFRLTVKPEREKILQINRIEIMSSDRAGRWEMGGKWDTYTQGIRALGVMRNGKVLNAGAKGMLEIEVSAPTVIDLYMDDGGMTSVWKYFTITVEAEGGYKYSTVMEGGTWHAVRR